MSEMGMFNHVPKPDEVAAKAFSMSRDEQEQWSWPSYCCGLSDGGVCDARVTEIMLAAMNGEFSHNTEQAFSGEPSPMHDHIEQLEAENERLREQVTQLRDDFESERDYADQMEAKERRAVAENAELRKFVQAVADDVYGSELFDCSGCRFFQQCYNGEKKEHDGRGCQWWLWARELGIEASDV